ncbi:DUF3168 domain-containing protein [Burkholderia thailandensis]|uniref:DUF3168 domain-containing protein n=1 Tax=Burkholderia thailandensis TaxID=57975 RepID=UPI00107E7546|nr:DUF3168 domain-containing protein [Burkholderia thailandensis]MCZ2897303.1 DUF3168 domain-containing protein [Burkholderia thailandensis]TGB34832.1 DUF3168 domain-containing protein [Burkholderia thailandensis]
MSSAEELTRSALNSLVGGRVHPDVAIGVPAPYIVYQAAGGEDRTSFSGRSALQNCRMQIAVWSKSRLEAAGVMRDVQIAMTAPPLRAKPIGAPVSDYDRETNLYGSRLDFSMWYKN